MAYHAIDFIPGRADNRELAEMANRQLAAMPLLRQRLTGVPVCSPQCRVQHPVITAGGHQFRHIVIGYAATDNLADTQLWRDERDCGGRLIYILVNPTVLATPAEERRTLVSHELVHCGEFIQNCGHAEEHCACFHQVARALNEAHGAEVRVLQACQAMRIAGYPCAKCNDCKSDQAHLCTHGRQKRY